VQRRVDDQTLWVIGSGTEEFRSQPLTPRRSTIRVTGKKLHGGDHYNILTFDYHNSDGGRRLAQRVRDPCASMAFEIRRYQAKFAITLRSKAKLD
jgi:hypothetical protein